MAQAPDAATLAALGLAGICRETLRVVRSRPPGFHFLCGMVLTLSLSLLAHVALYRPLFSGTIGRLAAEAVEVAFIGILVLQSVVSAAFCVFSLAPRYSGFAADADRNAHTAAHDLREMPRFLAKYLVSVFRGDSRLAARLVRTGPGVITRVAVVTGVASHVFLPYAVTYAFLAAAASAAACPRWVLLLIRTSYLAGVAHIVTLWRVACVLSALEVSAEGFGAPRSSHEIRVGANKFWATAAVLEVSAEGFGALRSSHQLLVGANKFWATAAVLVTLDSCAVAAQLAFGALVVDNRMGLGVWLRVAVGGVMAAALWTAVVAGMVAQVVVYFVCKNSNGTTKSPTDVGQKVPGNRKPE